MFWRIKKPSYHTKNEHFTHNCIHVPKELNNLRLRIKVILRSQANMIWMLEFSLENSEELTTFWDNFSVVVHERTYLAVITKFNYLREVLQWPPRILIQGFQLTNDNYQYVLLICWELPMLHLNVLFEHKPTNYLHYRSRVTKSKSYISFDQKWNSVLGFWITKQ